MQTIAPLSSFDSLQRAILRFAAENVSALPVSDGNQLVGMVTEKRAADLLLPDPSNIEGLHVADALEEIPVIEPSASPAEIVELMRESGVDILPVSYIDGRYAGCVSFSVALNAMTGRAAPPRIGGMATPLGVYLTSGTASGGVGILGLLLTGAVMAFYLYFVELLVFYGVFLLYQITHIRFFHLIVEALNGKSTSGSPTLEVLAMLVASGLVMMGFLALLRFAPRMAGLHAAEHQTVNAIEAGEPLTVEAVARMSRVHPRCGTNIWGFMAVTYLGVAILSLLLSLPLFRQHISLVMVFIFWYTISIVLNWKRFGAWLQTHLTTRSAKQSELASGICAGKELLRNHQAAGGVPPTRIQRLWNMGLVQILIGAFLMSALLDAFVHYLIK